MATIKNDIDVLLQATSPRILPANLPSNISLPWTSVSSRPTSLATLNATDGATLVTASDNAAAANAAVILIANDNKLVPVEKSNLRKEWDAIASEKAILEAQATAYGITTEKTTYSNAWQALATYLNNGTTWTTGVPSWINDSPGLSSTTDIDGTVFRATFKTYYDARVSLVKKVTDVADVDIASAATTAVWTSVTSRPTSLATLNATDGTTLSTASSNATAANAAIADMASDNIFSPVEKPAVRNEWNAIVSEKVVLNSQATIYSVTTENTAYNAAFQALANYLNAGVWASGIPTWITDGNLSVATVIVGATFRSTFKTYYDTRIALIQKLTDVAATTANWANVASRPTSLATLNATDGTTLTNASSNAATALTNANAAQISADSALTQLTNIASDSILSPSEKPAVKLDYDTIIAEQSGIDAKATSYGITTEKTAYDNAITALTSYLGTLTGWNTIPGSNVAIVGTTFRTNFQTVYTTKQALLNAIYAAAKVLADNAQTQANAAATAATVAQSTADNATTAINNIASDAILSPSEKPTIVQDYTVITAEQAGIDAQATSYGITTEKTTYDTAVTALTTYLGTLSGWNTIPGSNVAIVGTTFRTKFSDVYTTKQALLNKIAAVAKTLADTAQGTANTAVTNAGIANTAIAEIANDNKFSAIEKSAVRKEWDAIASEKAVLEAQATLYGITTEKTTYSAAWLALATYLNAGIGWTTGVPSWISDANLSAVTDITGSVFRSTFKTYYDARVNLVKKVTDVADADIATAATTAVWTSVSSRPTSLATLNATDGTTLSTASTNATNALNAISDMALDSKLSPVEKPSVRNEWDAIVTEKVILNNQATVYSVTTENTTYNNAFQALATYLNGATWSTGIPTWIADGALPFSTDIVGATFRSTFKAYYDARVALIQKLTDKAAERAIWTNVSSRPTSLATLNATDGTTLTTAYNNSVAANAAIADMAADSILSPVEKPSVRTEWDAIVSEKVILNTQASAYSITTENTAYNTAFQNLATYLNGAAWSSGIPSWIADGNLGAPTVIVGATFRSTFKSYYDTRVTLIQTLTNAAALRATWTGVSSKPTDAQIMNDQIQTTNNLAPGFLRWTNYGTNWTYAASNIAANGTSLILPVSGASVSISVVSTAAAQNLYINNTYTVSFYAFCHSGTRSIMVDLFPDTLPEVYFTVTNAKILYTAQFTPTHTDINGTVELRIFANGAGAQTEFLDIQLEAGSVRTPWKPNIYDYTNLNNKITSANYATFMAQQSVSTMAYVSNGSQTTGTRNLTLTFNSDGQNVIIHVAITLTTRRNETAGGYSDVYYQLYLNGNLNNTMALGQYPNMSGGISLTTRFTDTVYIAAPPAGNVTYSINFIPFFGGNGDSYYIYNASMEIIGLKR